MTEEFEEGEKVLATGFFHHKLKMYKLLMAVFIQLLCFLFLYLMFSGPTDQPATVSDTSSVSQTVTFIVLFILCLPLVIWYVHRDVAHRELILTDRSLMIRGGVLSKFEKTIPLERISEVSLVQDCCMSSFELHELQFQVSSGGAGSPIFFERVSGLVNAREFRDLIRQQRLSVIDNLGARMLSDTDLSSLPFNAAQVAGSQAFQSEIRSLLREVVDRLARLEANTSPFGQLTFPAASSSRATTGHVVIDVTPGGRSVSSSHPEPQSNTPLSATAVTTHNLISMSPAKSPSAAKPAPSTTAPTGSASASPVAPKLAAPPRAPAGSLLSKPHAATTPPANPVTPFDIADEELVELK